MLFEIEYTLLFYNIHYHLWGLHQLLDWEKIYFCMKRCERQEGPRRKYVADSQYFSMLKKTIDFSKYVAFSYVLILSPRKGLEIL
jgi:hypothetical protein